MKDTLKSVRNLAATLITLASLAEGANAAVVVTNWTMNASSIDFRISGTVDISPSGSALNKIYIGQDGKNNWVNLDSPFSNSANSFSDNGGSTLIINLSGTNRYFAYSEGDAVILDFTSNIVFGSTLDYQIHIEGGDLSDSMNPNNMVVVAGYSNAGAGFLNSNIIGSVSSVPEPSSTVLIGVGAFGASLLHRRRIKYGSNPKIPGELASQLSVVGRAQG